MHETVPGALLYTAELNDLLRSSLVCLFSTGSLGEEESALEDLMRVIEAHAVAGGKHEHKHEHALIDVFDDRGDSCRILKSRMTCYMLLISGFVYVSCL